MKYSTKSSALVAMALAVAQPSQAFTAPAAIHTGIPVASNFMKRPFTLLSSMQPDSNEGNNSNNSNNNIVKGDQSKMNMKNAMMASAALATALAVAPLSSEAAMSGGRMGGSSFSPSMSRSFSAPRSSYGGGGGGYGYRGGGYSAGYYARPSYITPMPFFAPTPFFSPFGVVSYGGGGLLPLFLMGGLALAASNVIGSIGRSSGSMFQERTTDSVLGAGTSVIKLSVALDVSDRDDPNSILSALERLAQTARTDSRVGLQNLSSQVALELLRRKSSISAASSEYKHFRDREKAQREFNSLSIQERGKFEKETISKYGGVDYSSGQPDMSRSGFNDKATQAVVTLVLAVDGDSTRIPNIRSISDVEGALRKIASDVRVSDCLQGAEILWTPEDRTETLSYRDVIADYPELTSV